MEDGLILDASSLGVGGAALLSPCPSRVRSLAEHSGDDASGAAGSALLVAPSVEGRDGGWHGGRGARGPLPPHCFSEVKATSSPSPAQRGDSFWLTWTSPPPPRPRSTGPGRARPRPHRRGCRERSPRGLAARRVFGPSPPPGRGSRSGWVLCKQARWTKCHHARARGPGLRGGRPREQCGAVCARNSFWRFDCHSSSRPPLGRPASLPEAQRIVLRTLIHLADPRPARPASLGIRRAQSVPLPGKWV